MSNEYETVITETGWGIYHYFLIVLSGLLSLAEANTSLIVPVVASFLVCDFKLNKDQATMSVATSSLGMAVGAFLFGSISDSAGRKTLIAASAGIVFCASVSLSFAQNNTLINLSVFILGLGVAGNNIVLRVYLIECLPARKRGTCLAVIDTFWVAGYLTALGISWSLMPSAIRMLGKQFRPSSWRVLVILYGAPSLVIACASGLLPPSPRHLLYRQRPRQALAVLRQMYAINNSKHADTYPQRNLEDCLRPDERVDEDEDEDFIDRLQEYFTKTWERIRRVYRFPYKRTTLCGTLACLLHFPGFVLLALWSTHVLQELEDADNKSGTCSVNFQNVTLGLLISCDQVNDGLFNLLLLISLGYVLGEFLLIIGIEVFGRKRCLIFSGVAGGVASLALIFRMHYAIRVVLSSIFLAAYAVGRTTTCVLLLENYPTALRGTMMGLTKILPHLAVCATLLFPRMTCLLTLIVASISLLSTRIRLLPVFNSLLLNTKHLTGAALVMLPVLDLARLPMKE